VSEVHLNAVGKESLIIATERDGEGRTTLYEPILHSIGL
jgi:hypothetical protein